MTKYLQRSFIDLNEGCALKALTHYKFSEKALIKAAELVTIIGISNDDTYTDETIRNYFKKLRTAFGDCVFYINSDFVFVFSTGTLVDIMPVHTDFRSHLQKVWIENKKLWAGYGSLKKEKFRQDRIDSFNFDNDIVDELDEDEKRKIAEQLQTEEEQNEFYFG